MTRIEHIGDATLYLGDCRMCPAICKADVLITDPVWPNCPPGLLAGADAPLQLWEDFWRRGIAFSRAVVILRFDSDPRFLLPVPMPFIRATILPYVIPGYIGRMLGGDELAYCFGRPISSQPGQRVIPGRAPSAQPNDRPANGHPCSRAQVHFDFLMRWWTESSDIVLDPFMGSGTTGVAALRLGRKFIGVEIEERWFDIACRRIEAEARAPRLPFAAAPISPEQIALPIGEVA